MAKEITVVKKLKNGSKLLSDGTVVTPIARAAFVKLDTPRGPSEDNPNGEAKFGLALLFKKGEDLSLLERASARKKKEKFGNKIPAKMHDPLRDQSEKYGDYDGFVKGAKYMNVSSKFKPQIVGRSPTEPMEGKDIYSGCWVRCNLNTYAYGGEKKHKGNNGVSFGVLKVQFIRDDEPLSGGSKAEEVFDDEGDDDDIDTSEDDDDDDLL